MPRKYRVSECSETNLTFPEELEVENQIPQKPNPSNPSFEVTYVNAFIAVLLALVLAVAVGLIVGLAHPALSDRPVCPTTPEPTPPTTLDPEVEWQKCVNMSWERGDCLPGLVCTTPKPSVTSPIEQTTTTSTVAPKVNMRLPDTLTPTHYNLLLQPDLYSTPPETFLFTGTVEIFFTCVKNTNQVVLHANNLVDYVSDTIELTDTSGNRLEIIGVNRDREKEFLTIRTSSSLSKGSDFILYLEFSGPLRNDLTGIYYSSYEIGSERRYLVASQLQPTGARKVFPCFDEPALKATFNVSIDRKQPLTAMSNTDVYRTETLEDGWYRDHFSITPPMSTYLLAFIISDFQCVPSNTTDHKRVNVCARPNVIPQTEFAASIAGKMQQFYEEYHNISLPLPKTGHVGVPDFNSGAMENWGLIIYRETALLYDPDTSTAQARQRVATVIAHELAHMWFGDLVTPSWWEDLWLNEGFASYLEAKGVHHLFPDWGMANNAIKDDVLGAMAVDSLMTSHPLDQPAETPAEISELFDTIAYSKGASVIRMMEFFLGEDTFRWGLANYLNDRKFGSAHHSDLFHFLTEQAQKDNKDINVTSVMNTWVVQTGFPVVTVKYDVSTGQVALSQKRFLLSPTADLEESSVWQIPISVVTGPEAKWDSPTTTWLKQKTGEINEDIALGAKWIIVNVKFQGYYRVNYDAQNWEALTEQLLSNHSKIEVANRIQIIDDSFNLGRGGETSQLSALKIAKYLKEEKDYLPWVGAQAGFTYLSDMLDLTPDYGLLRSFVQALVENLYTELGWEDNENQPHLQRLLQSTVLQMACGYGIKDCQEVAETKFSNWTTGESIPSGIQPLVYCQGVRKGDEEEWNLVFNKFNHSQSGAEKKTLLQALACSRKPWILERCQHICRSTERYNVVYLTLALEEVQIRRQDFELVLEAVAGNPLGREIAWDFFVTYWNTIFERFGGSSFTLSDLAASVTATFSTQEQLDKLTDFLETHPDQGTASATFRNAVETTKANLNWRSKNEQLIFDWLRKESSQS